MHLVQILLPLRDNQGRAFPPAHYDEVRAAMTEKFGGVTAYQRAPAQGVFASEGGQIVQDDIVIVEIMCDALDRKFWSDYRAHLTQVFAQDELVVRALPFEPL